MEFATLIVAKRFQLPGGGESVPGEPIEPSALVKPTTVDRLLRIGYLLGYDAGGNPVRVSRPFAAARRLAPEPEPEPERAPPPVRDSQVPISFGGAGPGSEDVEPEEVAPPQDEAKDERVEEKTEGASKPKRRRRKSTRKG